MLLRVSIFPLFFAITVKAQIPVNVLLRQYDYNRYNQVTKESRFHVDSGSNKSLPFEFQIVTDKQKSKNQKIRFISSNPQKDLAIGIEFVFENWQQSNYVLLPGCAYNGNKYDFRRLAYSPKLLDPRDIGPDKPLLLSDVPKLSHTSNGFSRLLDRSGALSVPLLGIYNSVIKQSSWVLFEQGNSKGDFAIDLEESRDRKTCWFRLISPVVRERYKYKITDNQQPSPDTLGVFTAGEEVNFEYRTLQYSCTSIQQFYEQYQSVRNTLVISEPASSPITFSQAFIALEEKFNRDNFVTAHGYYSVGMRENFLQDWQIGWTGGLISTYPLLVLGNATSKQNVQRNYAWLFKSGISPSGYFFDSGEKGTKWYGGDIRKPTTTNWHLIRKSADGLFYALQQAIAAKSEGITLASDYLAGCRQVADAMVKTFSTQKQLGQFVDSRTGNVVVGGSASAALATAALLLASLQFGESKYKEVALELLDSLNVKQVQTGLLNGGPGDALQNFDSESAYSLIESAVLAYETTDDKKYLQIAENAANQFSTWVIGYNYSFPPNSLFGKLGIKSTGAVMANTQNKHGAPGICTHSGLALLKLSRYTGNMYYASILKEITNGLTQYMGHPRNNIPGVKLGWMCERVSTTDWLEGIGEITYQSTWAETSLMLTALEIPSVYINPKKSQVISFDQVIVTREGEKVVLKNPTPETATYTIWIDKNVNTPLPSLARASYQTIVIRPGQSKTIRL